MSTGLIDIMKRAALDATDNAQMCDLRYGTVVSTKPLKVKVTNLFTIPEALLVVPEHLTDYTVKVSFDWNTELVPSHDHYYQGVTSDAAEYRGNTSKNNEHYHNIKSNKTKSITIHNALKVDDKVALLRKQGGQSYFILDRI